MFTTERDACERALQATREHTLEAARRQPTVPVELIATAALALSTVIAGTAVSIGIARAEVFSLRGDGGAAPLAIALTMGLLLAAIGGVTAFMADSSGCRRTS
jgi:hypothetical protein